MAFTVLAPLPSEAATPRQYRDEFLSEDVYSGNDGTDSWNGPWVEIGDDADPSAGAFTATNDGHCPDDICLLIGKDSNPSGSIVRGFNSFGAAFVTLTFDYERHVHGAGAGEVRLLVTGDGVLWDTLEVFPLGVDDGAPQSASYDISAYTGLLAAIRFDLVSSDDASHIDIDDVEIVASDSNTPLFDQDLADRTDAEADVVSIDGGATDPNGDMLAYSATGLPPGISIDTATGEIGGTIGYSAADSSPYSVQVTAIDPASNSDVETFTWTVTNTNRGPTADDRFAPVAEDNPTGVTIDLLDPSHVSDPDFDVLAVSALDTTSISGGALVDNGDGTVTYTPDPNFDQADSFGYTITDGLGGSGAGTVTITVNASPDDPVLGMVAAIAAAEETVASFTATAIDPDTGAVLQYALFDGPDPVPAGATIDGASGAFSWLTDEGDGPGTYSFTVRVTDDTLRYDEAVLVVDLAESNQAPMLGAVPDQASAEAAFLSLSIPVSDPDIPTGALTFGATGLPGGLTLDTATGVISGAVSHAAAAGSPYSVVVTVQDSGTPPLTDTTAFIWTVTNTNRAPLALAPLTDVSAREGDVVTIAVSMTDPDGDTLTYAATGLPTGLSINPVTGVISGAIGSGTASGGPYAVVVTGTDAFGDRATLTFTISSTSPPPPTTTTTSPPSTTTSTVGPSTTTTSPPPTTTLPPPGTSTTAPPQTTTATTRPPPATTTTTAPSPETTPTDEETGVPPNVTSTSTSIPTLEPAVRAEISAIKDELLVETGVVAGLSTDGADRRGLDPREGLAVSLVSAVETLKSHLLTSLLLGIGVAILLMLGIDDREEREALA